MNSILPILSAATFLSFLGMAIADPAVVEDVKATRTGDEWRFDVTLSHADTGWDDYADGWRVVGSDGAVLGFRELLHPHVNEQPFTRSLASVAIPAEMNIVYIETRTNADGWHDARFPLSLERN